MYLKYLEIFGFKSFAAPTTIEFEPGISVIVGPNGCGKSNILDAIRWALGEPSLKLLRGKKLDDLIFCGSKSQKPLGMAEISMTFATGGPPVQINIAGMPFELEEIKVTRRVFRDGETECLINKVPCRLKDLQDLYIDLNISNNLFSLIEQGRISSILEAKPSERRFLIEDASGISKYKIRKNVAQKKLEATKINLQRVQDVLGEVKRQLGSLKRQAKRAEEYRRLKEEERRLEYSILSIESSRILGALDVALEENSRLNEKEHELSAKKSEAEAKIESLKLALISCQDELSGARAELFETEKQMDKLSSAIKTNAERIGSLKQELKRISESRARFEREAAEDEALMGSKKKEMAGLCKESEAAARELQTMGSTVENLKASMANLQKELDSEKSSLIGLLSTISEANNKISSLQTQKTLLGRRRSKVEIEAENQKQKAEEAGRELENKTDAAALLESEVGALKSDARSLQEKVAGVGRALEKEKNELAEIEARLTFGRSALKSFDEMQKQYFNSSKAVRGLVEKKDEKLSVEGVRDVIGRLVEAAQGFELAIEAALGERVKGIVIDSQKGMIEAVNYLRKASAGKGYLIPLRPKPWGDFQKEFSSSNGYLGRGSELVSCPEEYKAAVNYLLGNVIVVSDFNSALTFWSQDRHGFTIVTLDGEIIDPAGAIWAGKSEEGGAGVLVLKREIKKLKVEICEAESLAISKAEHREEIAQEMDSLAGQKLAADENCRRSEKDLAQLLAEAKACEAELKRCRAQMEVCGVESEELDAELADTESRLDDGRSELEKLSRLKADAERRNSELSERAGQTRAELDAMIGEQNSAALHLASIKGKIETAGHDIETLADRKRYLVNSMTEKDDETANIERNIVQLGVALEDSEKTLAEAAQKKERDLAALSSLEEKAGELTENLRAKETEAKKFSPELEELRRKNKETAIKVAELKVEIEHKSKLASERGCELHELLKSCPPMAGQLAEFEVSLEKVRSALGNLGDVNLQAWHEYQNTKERHDFLETQYEDLIKSVDELQNTIARINKITQERFFEAFNMINNNFKEIFQELFDGGSADLVLTDETDIWETGVDIMAQPPGKKLQNIMLLSVGEKSMAAIALLIAIFLTKPGPFCFLDEVDAPLDESNIEKFCATIERLCEKTQFILVTHNRISIQKAGCIYGVTMEQDGVSKIISMKLETAKA